MSETRQRYFDNWQQDWNGQPVDGYQRMLGDFCIAESDVRDDEILYAVYSYGDYDGSAFVLFERDGKLYEVHAGHCSCYGLEGQWEPEETSWAAIAMRPHLDQPVRDLIASRLASVPPTEEPAR